LGARNSATDQGNPVYHPNSSAEIATACCNASLGCLLPLYIWLMASSIFSVTNGYSGTFGLMRPKGIIETISSNMV